MSLLVKKPVLHPSAGVTVSIDSTNSILHSTDIYELSIILIQRKGVKQNKAYN